MDKMLMNGILVIEPNFQPDKKVLYKWHINLYNLADPEIGRKMSVHKWVCESDFENIATAEIAARTISRLMKIDIVEVKHLEDTQIEDKK